MSENKREETKAPAEEGGVDVEIARRIATHAAKITRQLQGESGTVGLSALAYAMVACGKSIGVSEQDCLGAIKEMWDAFEQPKPSGG